MKFLLTNDDGIEAEGLKTMARALSDIGDVTVVAPETEMSAVGHSITIADPLRVRRVFRDKTLFGTAVNGTPADCVKIAIKAIMKQPPDMVISGINHGQNVATNIIYSGTVSAATEGMILGIPSVAISLSSFISKDFSVAADYGLRVILKAHDKGIPADTLLNVNVPTVPSNEIQGIKICRNGVSKFKEVFERRVDPRQNDYYWQGGQMEMNGKDNDADIYWLQKNWVTVTPIRFDLTDHDFLQKMKEWSFK
ncbi:5'-nucleotidase SurE [hydrothermal vent metagenome]|uniref:5'-nucleotidase n=1 Tax=hydrothermal vent metagenome TaxID=652676 RepID=A0A3B1C3Z7_9ZZZZ